MSAQTLIILGQSKLQNHIKTLRNASKIVKISQDCVLCVSDAKRLKTCEKCTKFAQLAVLVPQLSKIDKTSP